MTPSTQAAARAGDTLLRMMGGRTMLLRIPAPAMADDPAEQLGLATPQFQEIPLAPVVLRKGASRDAPNAGAPSFRAAEGGGGTRYELLVSALAVDKILGSLQYDCAAVLFATAAGLVSDDDLLEIVSATPGQAFGTAYVYRLVVTAPLERSSSGL